MNTIPDSARPATAQVTWGYESDRNYEDRKTVEVIEYDLDTEEVFVQTETHWAICIPDAEAPSKYRVVNALRKGFKNIVQPEDAKAFLKFQ